MASSEEDGVPKYHVDAPSMQAVEALGIRSEHRLRSENLPFDIDVWYPRLAELTPRSVFLPLTRLEAQAIVHFQATRFLGRKTLEVSDVAVLQALEGRIHECLMREFGDRGAMMRLCGRSPKDGQPLDCAAVWLRYQQELSSLLASGAPETTNTKLRAIGHVPYLCVTSGSAAMSLLLSSERVFSDCRDWLEYGEPEQIVLREWLEDLSLEHEFRAYINHGRITALSQYDHYTVYPTLLPLKQQIEAGIHACWARAHALLAEDDYAMDFAYLPHTQQVVVLELSPLLFCTGAALFSWQTESHLLLEGPYEFRLNNSERSNMDVLLDANWDQRWTQPTPSYQAYLREYSAAHGIPLLPFTAQAPDILLLLTASAGSPVSLEPRSGIVSSLERQLSGLPLLGAVAVGAAVAAWDRAMLGSLVSALPASLACAVQYTVSSLNLGVHADATLLSVPGPAAGCTLLFVYGTLKRGFHWHSKFLSFARFVGEAETVQPVPLVVGQSGVPYLLAGQDQSSPGPTGLRVRGEVYEVDAVSLLGLDQYEGLGKGYYCRMEVPVVLVHQVSPMEGTSSSQMLCCQVYALLRATPELLACPAIAEYTADMHRKYYNAIRHIRVKQERYLGVDAGSSHRS